MIETVECSGQPRDMGCDQGRVLRESVRRCVERAGLDARRSRLANLRPFTHGASRGSGIGRELIRHFTHQSERIDGLARFAGVDVDAIFELHARAARAEIGGEPLAAEATVRAGVGLGGAAGIGMLRGLPAPSARTSPWCLRRSRPEVGFASVEITLPWLVSAVAGVNEAGVCAALSPLRGWPGGRPPAAPSHLLTQECLQRFEDVGACIDWCLKRPVLGDGTIVLSDARGRLATVTFEGAHRSVDTPEKVPVGANAEVATLLGLEAGDLWVGLDAEARLLSLHRVGDEAERLTIRA